MHGGLAYLGTRPFSKPDFPLQCMWALVYSSRQLPQGFCQVVSCATVLHFLVLEGQFCR